jgi:hypothetical protein
MPQKKEEKETINSDGHTGLYGKKCLKMKQISNYQHGITFVAYFSICCRRNHC